MALISIDLGGPGSTFSPPAPALQSPAKLKEFRPTTVFYVATDLSTWWPQDADWLARDCQLGDICYRRLDPEYFAWLKLRMHAVKAASNAGRVEPKAFDELRHRFNGLQDVAVGMFGESALLEAIRTIDAESYRPPLPDEFERPRPRVPVIERPNPASERLVRARRLVDAIRDQALALGWTMDGLYFSDGFERRPFAAKYGLVCYIRPQHRIGEVTRQSIELIGPPPTEARSQFYNPDVEQPWIRRTR
jgi:hypothetical protein